MRPATEPFVLVLVLAACLPVPDSEDARGVDSNGVDAVFPADCRYLPVCTETPTWPLCPDPRCCEHGPSGDWRIVSYGIECLDVLADAGGEEIGVLDVVQDVAHDAPGPDVPDPETCDWAVDRPTSWGPAGVVAEAACPYELADVEATCFDYSGDGKGDSGFRSQCFQLVPDGGRPGAVSVTPLVLELDGLTVIGDSGAFRLNALPVEAPADRPESTDSFLVPEAAYDPATCLARNHFPGATLVNGHLEAGPTTLRVTIPAAPGASMNLVLVQARLRGEVLPGGGLDGFELSGGVFSAVLTKQAFDAGIAELQAVCDASSVETRPEWCQYIPVLRSSMQMMDLHQEADGTFSAKAPPGKPADAVSICFTFSLAKARVVGFQPAP